MASGTWDARTTSTPTQQCSKMTGTGADRITKQRGVNRMSDQRNEQKQQGGGGQQKPDQQQQQKPGQAGKRQEKVDKENREKAGDDTGNAGIGT